MSNRDDFAKKIIEILRSRVNNRCSNPNCRVPTTGPTTDKEKINNIGIAAHITAASPGGPRYEKSMSKKERKSINNAIWLCSNCSNIIDRDPDKYRVDILREWKKVAEKKASEEIGKKLPDDNYVIQSISAAFSGQSSIFLPKLLSNSGKASSIALERLDPRFSIKSNYVNGLTSFELSAKEPVDAKMIIKQDYTNDFAQKYKNFDEHGEKLVVDTQEFEMEGSPLLKEIFSQNGRLEVTKSIDKKIIQKIWVKNPASSEKIQLYDVICKATIGKSSLTFEGSACESIITIKSRINRHQLDKYNNCITVDINFKEWDNQDVTSLPYFDPIYEFFQKLSDGWEFHSSIEIDGKKLFAGTVSDFQVEFFQYLHSLLHYIDVVGIICRNVNIRGSNFFFDI
ncbi:MAG: hypothetical protein RQ739_09250 [Desulfotignum sp.]|nr:hypothetical protein [Desulfotignum sp.]